MLLFPAALSAALEASLYQGMDKLPVFQSVVPDHCQSQSAENMTNGRASSIDFVLDLKETNDETQNPVLLSGF